MTRTIEVELPYGVLVCDCGSREWSFCDENGELIDNADPWLGHYRCDSCGLVAHWPSATVVLEPTKEK